MRWTTVFALFLLAGIPSCSSEAGQSASLLSTTDPPTADIMDQPISDDTPTPSIVDAPDVVVYSTERPRTADEDYDDTSISKRNDTGDSTALANGTRNRALASTRLLLAPMDSVDSEDSSSLADEVSSTTSSERAMESEASSSPHNDISDEPSLEEDEAIDGAGVVTTPSTGGDSRLPPSPHPSIESHEDIQSEPLVGDAASNPNTNLTADLKGLSSSEINIRLDEAKLRETERKTKRDKAQADLEKTQNDAVEPNRIYEVKRKEWEELEKIAEEKERADNEYRAANRNLNRILSRFRKASKEFSEKKGEVDAAIALKAEVPTWPALQSEAERQKTQKDTLKTTLVETVESLQTDNKTNYDDWVSEEKNANKTLNRYNTKKCDEPAQAGSSVCSGLATLIGQDKINVKNVKNLYEETKSKLEVAENDLGKLQEELIKLEREIDKLKDNIAKKTIDSCDTLITKLNGELEPKQAKLDEATKQKNEAEAVLEAKKAAKERAEQSDDGISAAEARDKTIDAKAVLVSANDTKIKMDGKVEVAKSILNRAQAYLTEAQSEMQFLKDNFDVATRKEVEEAAQTRSRRNTIIGIVIPLVLLALIAIGGIGLCYWKKWCCFSKRSKPPTSQTPDAELKGKGVSHTPHRDSIKTSKSATTLVETCKSATPLAETCKSAIPLAETCKSATPLLSATPATTPVCRNSVSSTQVSGHPDDSIANDPQNPNAVAAVAVGPDPRGPVEAANPAKEPYIPGPPFKIPAKNFKWRGPMRRRTRWHGAPVHDFEGHPGVTHIDRIWFDPNANYATEIGKNEIIEDGGPPSDSDRSEWLNNLDAWEEGRRAMLAAQDKRITKEAYYKERLKLSRSSGVVKKKKNNAKSRDGPGKRAKRS